MMTEKEYDELVEKKELAGKFSDFWHGLYISIDEAMVDSANYGVVGLTDNDVFHHKSPIEVLLNFRAGEEKELVDFLLMRRICSELTKLKRECDKRTDYWDKVLDKTTDELESLEARIYERNADNPDDMSLSAGQLRVRNGGSEDTVMSDPLRRRASFWRNMEFSLDQMLEEVNSRSGDKWFNDEDKFFSEYLTQHLGNALKTVRTRYMQVLNDQIEDWNMQINTPEN